MHNAETTLASTALFGRLPPAERQHLAARARFRVYVKGETIFRAGQACDAVWLMVAGRAKLQRHVAAGKAITSCVQAAGDLFCCLPALDGRPYPVDAVASMACTVLKIDLAAVHRVMARHPSFAHRTICHFCGRLRDMEGRSCMLYEQADARIARVLLSLSKRSGAEVAATRQDLAELAGISLETAIRTIRALARRGLVSGRRGRIAILSHDGLARLALDGET
jgi:CRP/FNR family transcriptional regulator